jgi:CMP-N,N'-diacetyllegionaminic acid synthase
MKAVRNILGLIPARGGSKGIPHKNLAPLGGLPLIAHTINAAKASATISRVLVSTDDGEIATVSREFGAETPFLRPAELATDEATALSVIQHAALWLDQKENWRAEAVVYLQPTSPFRKAEHIDSAVHLLLNQEADSVVSVVEVPHNFTPDSLLKMDKGRLSPYLNQAGPLRRQDKPIMYARNGPAVLALTWRTAMELGTLYGPNTLPLIMERRESLDIDNEWDIQLAECILSKSLNE